MEAELRRVTPMMTAIGQDPDQYRNFINLTFEKAAPMSCKLRFLLRFLISPTRILDDGSGCVGGLEVEQNTLVKSGDEVKARSLGTKKVLDVDTVIFAIGDQVEENLGLAVEGNAFVKNQNPRFPVDGISYEAFNSATQMPIEDVFMAGWAREASKGLVGVARRDGTNAAHAVLNYLNTVAPDERDLVDKFEERISERGCFPITNRELAKLEASEQQVAREMGLEEYKFSTNPEMIRIIKAG
jgi:ferredoxin--NADP+ reductase